MQGMQATSATDSKELVRKGHAGLHRNARLLEPAASKSATIRLSLLKSFLLSSELDFSPQMTMSMDHFTLRPQRRRAADRGALFAK